MNWECDSCSHIHKSNPTSCSNCGHTVFSPTGKDAESSSGGSRTKQILIALLLIAIVLVGAFYVYSITAEEPAEELNRVQLEYQIHQEVNEERTNQGLAPLEFDSEIRTVARDYSKQMATEGFFGHRDAQGNSFQDRYTAAGYNCSVQLNKSHVLEGGENLAQSHYNKPVNTSQGVVTTHKTSESLAEGIVSGWMASEGHRDNILTPEWENEGIGVYVTQNKSVYVTQNFC